MKMFQGKLTCVPDQPRGASGSDDALTVDHYAAYDRDLVNAWRTNPPTGAGNAAPPRSVARRGLAIRDERAAAYAWYDSMISEMWRSK
jgi:hypothetical protein